ncbi:large ribosomal subunit protein eL37-like [Symphalangus syndactylus]|uniref:large ribosomal subunit protein eL37-like n=2 Tax=Hylobatidae TaxID=9577 RepID=UPI002443545D|nr:60S ribosomal protein L37-like [Symphalangus syndactylus]
MITYTENPKKSTKKLLEVIKSRSEVTKGTSSFGKPHIKTHTLHCCYSSNTCHFQKSMCGKCRYPPKHKIKYNWSAKAKRRNTTGIGVTRCLKIVYHEFRHRLCEGITPKPKGAAVAASSSF